MAKPAQEFIALTPKELAATAGVSSNYYAPIERGEVSIMVETLFKIAQALGRRRYQPTTRLNPRIIF